MRWWGNIFDTAIVLFALLVIFGGPVLLFTVT